MRIFMQTAQPSEEVGQFYQLILQEDLLGGWTVIRQWGKLGQRGRFRQEYFDDLESAQQALSAYRERQSELGFKTTFVEGEGGPG